MKNILTITLLFLSLVGGAQTARYVSATATGLGTGTQSSPWTLAQANAASFAPGDTLFIKGGDVIYGTFLPKGGQPGKEVVITTKEGWGTAAPGVLSGFTRITSWTDSAAKFSYTTLPVNLSTLTTLSSMGTLYSRGVVMFNGRDQWQGRVPNVGSDTTSNDFRKTTGSNTTTYVICSTFSAAQYVGGDIVGKIQRYDFPISRITAVSGDTIKFNAMPTAVKSGYGFFIQNHLKTLDQNGEWYYNADLNRLYVYFANNRQSTDTVRVSTVRYVVNAANVSNIKFLNLIIEGGYENTMHFNGCSNITVENCTVRYAGLIGISASSSPGFVLRNSLISDGHNYGAYLYSGTTSAIVERNTFKRNGIIYGTQAAERVGNYGIALMLYGSKSIADRNRFDSTGYSAIRSVNADSITISRNYITWSCLTMDDGGDIYFWNNNGRRSYGRVVHNNIIDHRPTIPHRSGGGYNLVEALYADDYSNGIEFRDNVVNMHKENTADGGSGLFNSRTSAIYIHNSSNNIIRNNLLYNTTYGLKITDDDVAKDSVYNLNVKGNVTVSKNSKQYGALYENSDTYVRRGFAHWLAVDSNYFVRPAGDENVIRYKDGPSMATTTVSLPAWRSYSGFDMASALKPANVSTVEADQFIDYNWSDSVVYKSRSWYFLDGKGKKFAKNYVLYPYTGIVGIKQATQPLDIEAPSPSNDGNINLVEATQTTVNITWERASDVAPVGVSNTPQAQLKYRVYVANEPINTLENVYKKGRLIQSGTNINSYVATGMVPGAPLYFNVVVEDNEANEALYSVATITLSPEDITPPVVGNGGVVTAANITYEKLDVVFTKGTDNVTPQDSLLYRLYRTPSGNVADSVLVATGQDVNRFTVTGLQAATLYYFFYAIQDKRNNRALSQVLSVTTAAAPVAPPAKPPVPHDSTIIKGFKQVSFVIPTVSGATSYNVYRRTPSVATFTKVWEDVSFGQIYDVGLSSGQTYIYVITAQNAAGESPASDEFSITTLENKKYTATKLFTTTQ